MLRHFGLDYLYILFCMLKLHFIIFYLSNNDVKVRYDFLNIKPLFNDLLVRLIHPCIRCLQSIVDRFLV